MSNFPLSSVVAPVIILLVESFIITSAKAIFSKASVTVPRTDCENELVKKKKKIIFFIPDANKISNIVAVPAASRN